jgi:threonine dehydratase
MLEGHGYAVLNLRNNELAKLHLCHMVGGRSNLVQHERLYRFEFPERPGALLDFLTKAAGRWNISLFHYRNHGAAYGRVLVGMEVPDDDAKAFQSFLDDLDYPYVDESGNPAYHLFL